MKKTKRPTEQELLHQWLEGDLDLTQQLYVEKDEPQPEAVEPYQPKRDRDTFLRSLRRSLRLYNVLAFLLCAVFAALMLMTVANLPRYGSADAPTVNEVAQRYVEQGTKETGAVNTVAGLMIYALVWGDEAASRTFRASILRAVVVCSLGFYCLAKSYSFFTGANHLHSIISPGTPGNILSGGLILPLNVAVGLVVCCTMYSFYMYFRRGEL